MSNKKIAERLSSDLEKLNCSKTIKLRTKLISGDRLSLYLDYWNGVTREYQFLKIYLQNRVTTFSDDYNKLKIAISIRDKRELEILEKENDFKLKNWKREANFLDYFESLVNHYPKTEKAWRNTLKHLKDFKTSIKMKHVDETFVEEFSNYLQQKVSVNTAHTYLSKIKASLNKAVQKGILSFNPASSTQIKKEDTEREFLTEEEIKLVIDSGGINPEIKQAFLFSCFTGLRLSDVKALTFDRISEGYLSFTQQKTQKHMRVKLSKSAMSIIEQQREIKKSGTVFHLSGSLNTILSKWINSIGINKHITFHCSRHTFATLSLTNDIDLYSVSKFLGHRNIKVTQIYAKLIDKKLDEAIGKLPDLIEVTK